jgi:hypothetical protein
MLVGKVTRGNHVHQSLDRAMGVLSYVKQRTIPRILNTHARMNFYERTARDQRELLFPAPRASTKPRSQNCLRMLGMECETLEFESLHEPLHPDEAERYFRAHSALQRFVVRRVRRPGAPPRRAAVYLHAWMVRGAQAADTSFSLLLSQRLDCDIFNVQQVHHGLRQIPGSPYDGAYFMSADVALTFEAFRQAVMDARVVVDYLLNSGQYDEVGLFGVSLGGAVSTLVACLEPRLNWVVPVVSHIDIADAVRHAPVALHARRQFERWGVSMGELSRINETLIGWLEPVIDRERLLLVPGELDLVMRPDAVRRQLAKWPGVPSIWLPGGHISSVLSIAMHLPKIRAHLHSLPAVPRKLRVA